MKPVLLSSASFTEGVIGYLHSLQNLENSVRWFSVEYMPTYGDLAKGRVADYQRCYTQRGYPGNTERLLVLLDLINAKILELPEWVIFTDTADVRFQTPIPNLDKYKNIIAAPEHITHQSHSWWTNLIAQYPVFEPLLPEPVYNMGCLAMRKDTFKEFLDYLYVMNRNAKLSPNCDQAVYNMFLMQHRDEIDEVPELMVSLFDNFGKTVHRKDGRFVTQDGKVISIVHANGHTKESL